MNVVRPNVDTLYSAAYFDLSTADLSVTLPQMDDRYWVFPVYDIYANNYANIGSVTNDKAGKYLLRYTQQDFGIQTENVTGDYLKYINSPTPYGITIVRIEVQNNNTDADAVSQFQNQMKLTPVPRSSGRVAPNFNLSMFSEPQFTPSANLSVAEATLRLTAALAPYNLPIVIQDRSWVAEQLSYAGVFNDTWTQPAGTNLTAAVEAASTSASALISSAGSVVSLGNNWTISAPQLIGNYNSFYAARYDIAVSGYLALTSDQAIYPSYGTLGTASFNPGPNRAYLLTFSRKPVMRPTGFWSLTAYNADQYLIPNDLGRYALGDRNNMTYPDGTRLSDTPMDDNRPFQILIQPADLTPPSNWTSNWLPSPAGGDLFSVNLRFYGAQPAMTNGSWVYPRVRLIDAITE